MYTRDTKVARKLVFKTKNYYGPNQNDGFYHCVQRIQLYISCIG